MIGDSVWVVEFFNKKFVEVYTSKERVLAAIDEDFRRNEGRWVNRTLYADTETSRIEFFYDKKIKVEICMYETCIQ